MRSKLSFGFLIASATGLVVSAMLPLLAGASAAGPAYLAEVSFTAKAQQGHLAKLSVTTGATIPRHPDAFIRSNPVVGFAWVDVGTSKAFVATIHPAIGRDAVRRLGGRYRRRLYPAAGQRLHLRPGGSDQHLADRPYKQVASTPTQARGVRLRQSAGMPR